jgi:MMPL family protein
MTTAPSPAAANVPRSRQNGLGRLAAWCYDHRRGVLGGWVLVAVAIIGITQWAGSRLDAPGTGRQLSADGLAATARVITAAAAIMVCVFGSFVIGDPARIFGVFGLGLAAAILVDATVVRPVLVPAVMQLLGTANWWLPRWMTRATPDLSIEPDADRLAGGGLGYARPVSVEASE